MQPINVGVIGLGTVGAGAVHLLAQNANDITRRAGAQINIKSAAVRDTASERGCDTQNIELTNNPRAIVEDPDIDVVLELIGGVTDAYDLVLAAIANGKHVVTANKQLIAMYGEEIFAAADQAGVMVTYEAAVAGGIPIIKVMRESLAANRIQWLAGIINGTGNFILSQMKQEGSTFTEALTEAQRLGFAEADPTFDIEGTDAAHKLTILASIAFGIPLSFDKVYTQGIRELDGQDIEYAAELGYRIKHLGLAIRREAGVELRVHPTLVLDQTFLADVEGEKNAIMVYATPLGATGYYGSGAGAGPTASAVVADLIDTIRAINIKPTNRVPHLAFQPEQIEQTAVLEPSDFVCGHYFRMQVADEPGVMAEITGLLAEMEISIESILQKEPPGDGDDASIIILTKPVREGHIVKALERIQALPYCRQGIVHLRAAEFKD